MWGKGAASVKKYLVKGKRVAVDGELQLEQWDQDGTKRQKVVISTFDVQLLDGGDKPAQNDDGFAWSKHDDESGGIPF
jgi:single-strand DNA-binding protein